MHYWFAEEYLGSNWTPKTHKYGQSFINNVARVRNHLQLQDSGRGKYTGSEWIPYTLGGRLTEVCVTEFIWNKAFLDKSDKRTTLIRFHLHTKIRWFTNGKEFSDKWLVVEFPKEYPIKPPSFYTEKYAQYGPDHDHHTLDDGGLCILTVAKDWGPNDTIINALGVAFNRIVEHYLKYRE